MGNLYIGEAFQTVKPHRPPLCWNHGDSLKLLFKKKGHSWILENIISTWSNTQHQVSGTLEWSENQHCYITNTPFQSRDSLTTAGCTNPVELHKVRRCFTICLFVFSLSLIWSHRLWASEAYESSVRVAHAMPALHRVDLMPGDSRCWDSKQTDCRIAIFSICGKCGVVWMCFKISSPN